jgi:hypothetical protein
MVENYDVYNINEVTVYFKKGIKVKNDQIHIFMRRFLWMKDLAVDGMSINY